MSEMIPEGWNYTKLSSVIVEFSRKTSEENEYETFTSSKNGLIKQSDYYGENRLTRRSNIGFNIIPNNYITYRSRSDNNRFTFNLNTLGYTGIVSKYYPVFTSKAGVEYNKFLIGLINYHAGRLSLESVGTSQLVLSFNAVKAVSLPTPPLPEQKKIASILTSVDDVIEKTQAQIDKLKDLKIGMMQELLTKGIGHTEFKDSPVGRIPVGWEVVPLVKLVLSMDSGWSPQCEPRVAHSGEWGVLKTTSVTWNGFDYRHNKKLPEALTPRPKVQVKPQDILITRAGPADRVGVVAYVDKVSEKILLSDKLIRLKTTDRCNPMFLSFWLSGQYAKSFFANRVSGLASSQTNISQEIVKAVLCPVPSVKEQEMLSASIYSVAKQILNKQRKLAQLQSTKKALIQDLLTGKVRVNHLLSPEELAEAEAVA